jgi:hypothetical protein
MEVEMRKLLSALLGLALAVTVFLTTLALPAFGTVFSNQVWVDAFLRQDLADALVRAATPPLLNGQLVAFDPRITAALSPEQGRALTLLLLPPGWAQDQTEKLVNGLLNFLRMETDDLRLEVDLNPVKSTWRAQARPMADLLFNSWPFCTQADLAAASAALLRRDLAALPICQPQQALREQVIGALENQLLLIEEQIAPQVLLTDPPLSNREALKIPFVRTFRFWYRLLRWGPALFVAVTGGLVVLNWRQGRRLTAIWGSATLLGGLLASGMALSVLRGLGQASFVSATDLQIPVELTGIILTAYAQVMTDFALGVITFSAIVAILGVIVLVGGRWLRH